MTQGTDHERNDRIEATVMMAALATLGLLVAMAVSTSMTALSGTELQAELQATITPETPEAARDAAGLDPAGLQLQGSRLR